jgi:heme-degrading monooxygenase HmoA
MHARVSIYHGNEPDTFEEGLKGVAPQLESIDGFSHALFLIDRESGKAMSITVWDSEAALKASAERANQLRQQATQPSGASIDSVEQYEVAMTVGHIAHA